MMKRPSVVFEGISTSISNFTWNRFLRSNWLSQILLRWNWRKLIYFQNSILQKTYFHNFSSSVLEDSFYMYAWVIVTVLSNNRYTFIWNLPYNENIFFNLKNQTSDMRVVWSATNENLPNWFNEYFFNGNHRCIIWTT